MKKYILILICVLGLGNAAFAQQDPHFSQYMFNHLVLNPAYAGSWGYLTSNFIFRKQWVGFDGAPETQSFSVHAPTRNDRHGFGLGFVNDKIGVTKSTGVSLDYAFRIHLSKNARLAFGLNGTMINYQVNMGGVRTGSDINGTGVDPAFSPSTSPQNAFFPNVGAGVFFHTKHFYAGASAPKLLDQQLPGGYTTTQSLSRKHFFFTTGLVFGKDDAAVKFKPSVLVKYQPESPISVDLNAHFLFADRLWLGVSYRTEDAIVGMVQLQALKWLRIGYAYDYVTSDINPFAAASHEFLLGLDLNFKQKAMVSPRYF